MTPLRLDGKSDNRLPEESDLQDKAAGKLTYDLKIRTGKYYIYAVANADDLRLGVRLESHAHTHGACAAVDFAFWVESEMP